MKYPVKDGAEVRSTGNVLIIESSVSTVRLVARYISSYTSVPAEDAVLVSMSNGNDHWFFAESKDCYERVVGLLCRLEV